MNDCTCLNNGDWTRVRGQDDRTHHVDRAKRTEHGNHVSLCTRAILTPTDVESGDVDAIATCSLCMVLWRNVYPRTRYFAAPNMLVATDK